MLVEFNHAFQTKYTHISPPVLRNHYSRIQEVDPMGTDINLFLEREADGVIYKWRDCLDPGTLK